MIKEFIKVSMIAHKDLIRGDIVFLDGIRHDVLNCAKKGEIVILGYEIKRNSIFGEVP
jgi:hypothetical protein